MSRSFSPFLLCAAIIVIAVLAVPVWADSVTLTATATATPTLTVTPTSTATSIPVTTTTVPVTTATPTPTQTTIIPTATATTVPVTTVTTTTTATPVPTTVGPQIPVAGFSGSPVSGTAPLTVQFTDTSTNTPISWSWNFGDGNTSTSQNPSYTYTAAGTYSVSHTAANTAGISAIDTQSAYITVGAATTTAPVASFTESPASGATPLTVQFTDTSNNTPTSWSWDFGDGNTSTAENPSYIYTAPGTYTVTLTAINNAGNNIDTQSSLITVNAATTPPIADFTQTASSGSTPFTVRFTDDSANSPTSWSWSFGDGNTSTDEDPTYTYTTAGTYTVSLTATNAGGSNSTTVDDDITVIAGTGVIPVASFTESDTSGTAPLTIQFTDESDNSPTSWSWNFGDGGTSTDENPTHSYTNPGSFAVTLTAANDAGTNTSVQEDTIGVSAAPVAVATFAPAATITPEPTPPEVSFEGIPTSGAAPLMVRFTPTAPGSPESFAWDFGDGGTSTDRDPTYTYTTSGTYTVTLTVKYPSGSRPLEKASYIVVAGDSSTSSPVSPAVPLLALGIAGMVVMIAGRRRG